MGQTPFLTMDTSGEITFQVEMRVYFFSFRCMKKDSGAMCVCVCVCVCDHNIKPAERKGKINGFAVFCRFLHAGISVLYA